MPRSENRKSLEVPTAVYEQLQAEAKHDGRTVAQVVMDLITDGRDAREHHGRVVDELHENRIELERMRRQVAELAAGARPRRRHLAGVDPGRPGDDRRGKKGTKKEPRHDAWLKLTSLVYHLAPPVVQVRLHIVISVPLFAV